MQRAEAIKSKLGTGGQLTSEQIIQLKQVAQEMLELKKKAAMATVNRYARIAKERGIDPTTVADVSMLYPEYGGVGQGQRKLKITKIEETAQAQPGTSVQ